MSANHWRRIENYSTLLAPDGAGERVALLYDAESDFGPADVQPTRICTNERKKGGTPWPN